MTSSIDRKTTAARVGQRVQLRETHLTTGHHAGTMLSTPIGSTATIIRVVTSSDDDHRGDVIDLAWDEPETAAETGYHQWGFAWFDIITEELARPLIHFDDEKAGRNRAKARKAAHDAISTTNRNEHTNATLTRAANGESVDAYDLNAAMLDAMRSVITRGRDAEHRRELSTGIAHIGHIVQAVLDYHADALPAYAEGERSRALKDAQSSRDDALRHAQQLEGDLEGVRAALAGARARAEEAWREVVVQTRILDYTRTECVADEQARQRSYGFEDGLRAERS